MTTPEASRCTCTVTARGKSWESTLVSEPACPQHCGSPAATPPESDFEVCGNPVHGAKCIHPANHGGKCSPVPDMPCTHGPMCRHCKPTGPPRQSPLDAVAADYWQVQWERGMAEQDALRRRIDSLKEGLDAALQAMDKVSADLVPPSFIEAYNFASSRYQEEGFDA
jgi:hypothetical protein